LTTLFEATFKTVCRTLKAPTPNPTKYKLNKSWALYYTKHEINEFFMYVVDEIHISKVLLPIFIMDEARLCLLLLSVMILQKLLLLSALSLSFFLRDLISRVEGSKTINYYCWYTYSSYWTFKWILDLSPTYCGREGGECVEKESKCLEGKD